MSERPYLIVSADSHAGPSLRHQLRPYCPAAYLNEFDAFVEQNEIERQSYRTTWGTDVQFARAAACPGQHDVAARLADMDHDGVSARVSSGGAENAERLPFVCNAFTPGPVETAPGLRAVGDPIWNEWLA